MKKLLVLSILAITSSAGAAAPNLAGSWTIHTNVAGQQSDQPCTFTIADNKIGGSCKNAAGKDVPITGTVASDKTSWKYESDYNGTPLTITFTVTGTDGNKITGTIDVDPLGVSGDFTGTPSKDQGK